MPSLPQSNTLQEIQRAFLERDAELRRLFGDTKTTTTAAVSGLRKTVTGRGSSGGTTDSGGTTPTATTVKGRRVITAISTEALSFYETNYTQAEFTESADIISIQTNHPAWVRVYSSAAARLADASRLFADPPVAGTGLMVEVLTYETDGLLIYLSPVPFWNNCDTVLGKTAYIAVTRWDNGDPENLEMTFTILPQEEMDKNGSQGLQGPRGFTGDGFRAMDERSATESYLEGDVVGRNGSSYCSLLNDNLNQTPETATTYWTLWASKGDKGDKGDTGAAGEAGAAGADGAAGAAGADGLAATIEIGTVSSGTPAAVHNSGTTTAAVLDFTIPPGADGEQGEDGTAATIAVGTVTSGTSPSVINSGTPNAATLDFVLPKGDSGDTGADGRSILSGTSDPTSSDGANGDFWINTTTHYLFGPKASGSWPTGVSLVGGGTLDVSSRAIDPAVVCSTPTEPSGNYTGGLEFQPFVAVNITAIRFYGFNGRTYRLSLWGPSGTRITYVDYTATSTGWVTVDISDQALTAGSKYKVSVYNSSYEVKFTGTPLLTTYMMNPWVLVVAQTWYAGGDACPASTSGSGRYPVIPILST